MWRQYRPYPTTKLLTVLCAQTQVHGHGRVTGQAAPEGLGPWPSLQRGPHARSHPDAPGLPVWVCQCPTVPASMARHRG